MGIAEQKPAAMRESRDIEWLVNWTIEKQGLRPGEGIGAGDVSGPGWADYGTRIDSSGFGGGLSGRFVHEDAQLIADAIGHMAGNPSTKEAGALIVQHGRSGTQPDWGAAGSGRWVLQRRNNGQGKAIRRYRDQRGSHGLIGFDWQWVGHQAAELDFLMVQWLTWHQGLSDLRDIVNAGMRQYVATGPRWPMEPWDAAAYVAAEVRELERTG